MHFNRSEIMKEVWTIVRRFKGRGEPLRALLSRVLKNVWWTAKQAARMAARYAAIEAQMAKREVWDLLAEIQGIENKDRMFAADFQRIGELRAALAKRRCAL